MASKFLRRQKWWIKLRHPATGRTIRESLDTTDEKRAELLRQRLELEAALLDPRFSAVEIPDRIHDALGLRLSAAARMALAAIAQPAVAPVAPPPPPVASRRATVDEAVAGYLKHVQSDNAALHFQGKVSMLRRFLGVDRIEKLGGPVKQKRKRREDGTAVPDPEPFFKGTFLDEITPTVIRDFIEGSGLARKTMRHYREVFHHLFEVALKYDLYVPTNWHRPNPVSALPSYTTRNHRIVFLRPGDIEKQLAAFSGEASLQMAVQVMVFAGLRRAEALWLTKDSFSPDLTFLSVLHRRDADQDIESSLKTGERSVAILPPLREALEKYLPTLQGEWLIPSPTGSRWRPDCFTNRLRALNKKAGLPWTCLHFRHTYATQRAAEGWSLFQIAKEMGNSVQVVEEYYAGYIRPASLSGLKSGEPDPVRAPASGAPA